MQLRRLFFVEAGLASIFAVICVITLFWPDWIELTIGADPDQGSGEAEWAIAAVLGLIAIVNAVLARVEWRRARRLRREAANV